MFVVGVTLYFLVRSAAVPSSLAGSRTVIDLLIAVPFLAFPLVGALIASRRPYNPIGWICLAVGFLFMLLGLSEYYGVYDVAKPGSLPFSVGIASLGNWMWVPAVGLIGTYLLLLLTLCILASIVSLVLRYRHSGGDVREQIKWVAFAASFKGVLYLAIMSAGTVIRLVSGPEAPVLGELSWWGPLAEYVVVLSFAGVPVAIGFAVLKYRLYDIDLIINRALVYGSLTTTVVGLYVLLVGSPRRVAIPEACLQLGRLSLSRGEQFSERFYEQ
jgi:hypothetical protein